ncbi:MAG TPA: hypothetical protein VGV37_22975 [Aliidongia sp.]|uniref:hypothetical protein n=1 Tax=Aliidongia sp. TaxID=1914230 RepID=UPI002DDDBD2F|nr:hypothetical protein [Aliidongia sp.]HEV2677411.1 hypothetical protein [Aliidongia sp.]
MGWLGTILREAYGLFVDDGLFAVAILLWLGVTWQILPRLGLPPDLAGIVLFGGLALILLESAVRRSRRP